MKYLCTMLIGLSCFASLTFSSSNGPPDGYAGLPPSYSTCVACHSSYALNSGPGQLQLTAPATYTPGQTYDLEVQLSDPVMIRWGFELSVVNNAVEQAGTLVITQPTYTQLSDNSGTQPDFLKHTDAGTFNGTPNGTTWQYQWTAPLTDTGPVTFYAAGVAANDNNNRYWDYVYSTSVSISAAAIQVPQAIDDLAIVHSASNAELSWSPVTADTSGSPISVSRYVIYASLDPDFVPTPSDSIGVSIPPVITFTDTNALNGEKRFYNVKAKAGD